MIALLKVSIILGIIVVLLTKNFPLAWALLGGSLIMGISFGIPFNMILKGFWEGLSSLDTIKLVLILYLIALFENILREKDLLKNMVLSFKKLINDIRLRLISMPIIMGLLPSVGGALFSAPLLEELSKENNIDPERKSYINYWFRHVWEPFLPIYPGIILASVLTERPLNFFVREALPYGLAVLAIGLFFAFYRANSNQEYRQEKENLENPNEEITENLENLEETPTEEKKEEEIKNPLPTFLISILPILVLLILVIFLHSDLLYTLIGLNIVLFLVLKFDINRIKNLLLNSINIQNLILIVGVMIFKRMLEITGAVSDIAYSLNYSFIPTYLIFFALPLIIGIFTGVTSATVGITFPILIKMLPYQDPSKYIILAFISSFLGIMVSPLHLCLILTKEYFKPDWKSFYNYVLKSGVLLGIFILIKFFLT
ncbi:MULTISPECIES: DUF401 family protein [Dictyoglomus]|uniref:DUF401 family protein n=3 Tax=Dictyoglomus TaxID=13 RepID=B8E0P5_DICTD|nr:DUF401 family protein [Dictyoglomus turgidum]ACK43065.1 protein of unknown function DUF401 [Dictyoglomus turgidum DSM 6724]PNV78667.1 MAG: DUF401 domain-containing protein [Dictyoglomus turgidum]